MICAWDAPVPSHFRNVPDGDSQVTDAWLSGPQSWRDGNPRKQTVHGIKLQFSHHYGTDHRVREGTAEGYCEGYRRELPRAGAEKGKKSS